jgi:hypothetical protein
VPVGPVGPVGFVPVGPVGLVPVVGPVGLVPVVGPVGLVTVGPVGLVPVAVLGPVGPVGEGVVIAGGVTLISGKYFSTSPEIVFKRFVAPVLCCLNAVVLSPRASAFLIEASSSLSFLLMSMYSSAVFASLERLVYSELIFKRSASNFLNLCIDDLLLQRL